jgi:hypothetical protein
MGPRDRHKTVMHLWLPADMKNKNNEEKTYTSLPHEALPTLSDPPLWGRIETHLPILAADAALVGRLRAEGALPGPDPNAALLEYLRFAYLAWTDPQGATPSKIVDEIWHSHILFTRSYARFCQETRGELLHHDPGGGEADEERFRQAYRRTVLRYEDEFGPPPEAYWPRPAAPPVPEAPPEPDKASPARAAVPIAAFLVFLATAIAVHVLTGSAASAILSGVAAGTIAGILLAAPGPVIDARAGAARERAARASAPRPPARPRSTTSQRRSAAGTTTSSSGDGGVVAVSAGQTCTDGSGGSCGDGGGSSCGGGGGCGGG